MIRGQPPFAVRGLDTDNDIVFMNEALQNYCREHELDWTRSRAYQRSGVGRAKERRGGASGDAIIRRSHPVSAVWPRRWLTRESKNNCAGGSSQPIGQP